MRIEKGVISSSQLVFFTTAFVLGSSLATVFTHGITKQDTWLVVLSGFAVILPFIWAYVSLAQKFPGKNLVQVIDIVYGSYLGKLISVFFISYPFQVMSLTLLFISDFFLTYMYPKTPLIVILIMFTAICAWAVRSGIEVIARISLITVAITLIVDILTFLLLFEEMNFTNFLPVFELSMKDFIQGTHIMAAIPYGELVVFLMIIPYVNKIKQAKSSVLTGLAIGMTIFLIFTVRDIASLGILTTILTSPSFEAVRLIDIGNVITRMELLVAVVLLVTVFIKISACYYATVLGIAHLFRLRSYVPLVLPIGILNISFAVISYEASIREAEAAIKKVWPSYVMLYLLLPILTLLIAAIRRLPHKQGGENK